MDKLERSDLEFCIVMLGHLQNLDFSQRTKKALSELRESLSEDLNNASL